MTEFTARYSSNVSERWASGIDRVRHDRHGRMDIASGRSDRFVETALTTSSCLASGICAIYCDVMPITTIGAARTCPWARMPHCADRFKALGKSLRDLCSVAYTIATFGSDFRQGRRAASAFNPVAVIPEQGVPSP